MHVEADPRQEGHYTYVAEKDFEYRLRVGFPASDEAGFLPNNGAAIVALWLRVENLSQRDMDLDPGKFSATDGQGHEYARLTGEEAFNRIVSAPGRTRSLVSKTVRGISLGKVAGKSAEEQTKDETIRFALERTRITSQGLKEGLIFFEAPTDKTFQILINLNGLWSKPFEFTNVKTKK